MRLQGDFPDDVHPKRKPYPDLIIAVKQDETGQIFLDMLELPSKDDCFSALPHAPYGQNPKLGNLHPSMIRVAAAALAARLG